MIVTRLLKTLRTLESDVKTPSLTKMRRELLILEFGYVLLLCGTKRGVIDVMVPDHKVRIDYLVENLRISEPQADSVKKVLLAAGGDHAAGEDL